MPDSDNGSGNYTNYSITSTKETKRSSVQNKEVDHMTLSHQRPNTVNFRPINVQRTRSLHKVV